MKCIRILFLLLIFPKLAFTQQDIDSTLLELNQQLNYSDTKLSKINALLEIGNYQISREFNKAESYFLDAKNIIESSQDNYENQLAFIYTKLGVINRRKGNYGNAITLYYKAKVIYEKLKDTSKLGEVIHNTAMLNRFQGDDKKAINNYKKSLSYSLKMKDTFNTAAAYNMMGVSYRRLKLIDSALTSYKKAKKLFQLLNNEEEIRGVNNNIATLYSIQKLYKKSLPIKLDNLNYYKKIGNKSSMSTAYYNVSKDYSYLKRNYLALKYADSSLNIALNEGFKHRISKAYLRKSAIYRDIKDFENAYRSYRYFKKYSDSIFLMQSITKNKELEQKFKFEKEKQDLEVRSNQAKTRFNFYIFILITVIIALSFIAYLLWRNFTARVRIVAEKLERERLSKELLDEKVKVSEAELKWLIADNKMRLIYLKQFYETLRSDFKVEKLQQTKVYIRSLLIKLQQQISTEEKLSDIQDKVETLNRSFEEKLIDNYPNLTKSEREVCGLLRVNLSIKEVASIRNTSIDSIKSIRYRLRKKMNLDKNIELEKFIQSL